MPKTFVMSTTRLLKKDAPSPQSQPNTAAKRKGNSIPAVPVLQNTLPVQKVAKKDEPLQGKFTAQLKSPEDDELPLQGKFTIQKKEPEEDELAVQGKFISSATVSTREETAQRVTPQKPTVQKRENKTGLPDNLKEGAENLSGMSLDDVRVKYNSDKPAQLNALAYARGTDIHVAPGQEKHLPHEAWHVVQQKQGRVRPTMQMKEGVAVNDDKGLEHEADVMGGRAMETIVQYKKPEEEELLQGKFKSENTATGTPSVVQPVVQRNGESAKLLAKLATPQVFPGPQIELQNDIVKGLEEQIDKEIETLKKNALLYNVTCVGGIELEVPESGKGDLNTLISKAQLVELKDRAVGRSTFELVKKAGVEDKIVTNTLATMEAAGQLEYLRESGLIDKNWKVIVEIHYYRDRDKGALNLHKDTLGQTLFVNLSFVSDKESAGPEFIINPASSKEYDKYVEGNLPKVFVEDLESAKSELGEPKEFGASKIPKNGVVAFVDEAIHHKTPTLGHRKVKSETLGAFISKNYPLIKEGYDKYKKRWTNMWSFSSFLDSKYLKDADAWLKIMTKIEDKRALFDRTELAHILPETDIDTLIEEGGAEHFGSASVPKFGKMPVKKEGRPPLKRQMSRELLEGTAPKPVEGRRTFFRTWVRAVPVAK